MFLYQQRTGRLYDALGAHLYTGYSGYHEGKNNPELEQVHDVGPIPKGYYHISAPFDSPDHGPYCLRLTPVMWTNTYGRDGFLMHGDSKTHPGEASRGCIIMPRAIREAVNAGKDKTLHVTE